MARVTRGTAFPYGGGVQPTNAVMLTAEDGLADTVRGRLELAGADLDRAHIHGRVECWAGSRIRFGRPSNA